MSIGNATIKEIKGKVNSCISGLNHMDSNIKTVYGGTRAYEKARAIELLEESIELLEELTALLEESRMKNK